MICSFKVLQDCDYNTVGGVNGPLVILEKWSSLDTMKSNDLTLPDGSMV